MNNTGNNISKMCLAQIAWVVKDIEKSKTFFQEMFGVKNLCPQAPLVYKIMMELIMEN